MVNLLRIENGVAIPRAGIPNLPFATFRQLLTNFSATEGYVVHFFAYEEGGSLRFLAVLRSDELFVVGCEAPEEYEALASDCAKFQLFEREMAEQYGVRPKNHPCLRAVRYHPNQRGVKDAFGNDYRQEIPGNYEYFSVEGEAVHEVGVGPVHAGIIEPGHFRFNCLGEEVLHLEIQLGYQYRGVERLLTTARQNRWPLIAEGIAGDTAIGHGLCHVQAVEALAGLAVGPEARRVRTLALELERLANHVGDLGALSGDVAFNLPAAYFGRLRGEFLNLLLLLSGNRFGKGLLRPGGVTIPFTVESRRLILAKIADTKPELAHVSDLLFSAHTVLARFEGTGTVSLEQAEKIGLVGVAGRASGLGYDARIAFPNEGYRQLPANKNERTNGDVFSRANVRREEIEHSLELVRLLASEEVGGSPGEMAESYRLAPDALVVTVNEGWRGELSHCLLTDGAGSLLRYKIKDPSFHNWLGLALALRGQQISDFPLCNKSFNLSYCGFDL